jgi:hypothetical protein
VAELLVFGENAESDSKPRDFFGQLVRSIDAFGELTLKGGLALEFRLAKARSTKDIDLGIHGMPPNGELILERLQAATRLDLGDFLTFEVAPDREHPTIENDGMRYDGFRVRGSCKLAGKEYGSRSFGIDVSLGDELHRDADELVTHDWLDFVGIPATKVRAIEWRLISPRSSTPTRCRVPGRTVG